MQSNSQPNSQHLSTCTVHLVPLSMVRGVPEELRALSSGSWTPALAWIRRRVNHGGMSTAETPDLEAFTLFTVRAASAEENSVFQ